MMKKKEAIEILKSEFRSGKVHIGDLFDKESIEREIRYISGVDKTFENIVFELGCSTLAKAYLKEKNN